MLSGHLVDREAISALDPLLVEGYDRADAVESAAELMMDENPARIRSAADLVFRRGIPGAAATRLAGADPSDGGVAEIAAAWVGLRRSGAISCWRWSPTRKCYRAWSACRDRQDATSSRSNSRTARITMTSRHHTTVQAPMEETGAPIAVHIQAHALRLRRTGKPRARRYPCDGSAYGTRRVRVNHGDAAELVESPEPRADVPFARRRRFLARARCGCVRWARGSDVSGLWCASMLIVVAIAADAKPGRRSRRFDRRTERRTHRGRRGRARHRHRVGRNSRRHTHR